MPAIKMKTVYGLRLDEDRTRSSFSLKLTTELWWLGYDQNRHFETLGEQSIPLNTTRCNLVGRGSSLRNEDRIRSSFLAMDIALKHGDTDNHCSYQN